MLVGLLRRWSIDTHDSAPPFQQNHVAPAAPVPSDELSLAYRCEPAFLKHGKARLVLRKHHRLKRPDTFGFRCPYQCSSERASHPPSSVVGGDIQGSLGHPFVAFSVRDTTESSPPNHPVVSAGNESTRSKMTAVPLTPRGSAFFERGMPGRNALAVDRPNVLPVSFSHDVYDEFWHHLAE